MTETTPVPRTGSRTKLRTAVTWAVVATLVVAAGIAVFAFLGTGDRNGGSVKAESDPAGAGAAVPITVQKPAPKGIKIGLVMTLGGGVREGTQWQDAASGAVVAQAALARAGSDIELLAINDQGSAAQAKQAVADLIDADVSGIVFATGGNHIHSAVSHAADQNVPVILAYGSPDFENVDLTGDGQSVWSFAPDSSELVRAYNAALRDTDAALAIDAGYGFPPGVDAAHTLSFDTATAPEAFAQQVAQLTGTDPTTGGTYLPQDFEVAEHSPLSDRAAQIRNNLGDHTVDAIVLSGHSRTLAALVTAFQQRGIDVPIVLSPEATSPGYIAALEQLGGVAGPNVSAIGTEWVDTAALGSTQPSRNMAEFLSRSRALAQETSETAPQDITGERPFTQVAGSADARSHDAIISLVTAAREAGSTNPAAVRQALAQLKVTHHDGVALNDLDFASLSVPATVLVATTHDLGLRPEPAPFSWFVSGQHTQQEQEQEQDQDQEPSARADSA